MSTGIPTTPDSGGFSDVPTQMPDLPTGANFSFDVGEVTDTLDVTNPAYQPSSNNESTIWTDYQIRSRYERDGQTVMLPYAADPGGVAHAVQIVAGAGAIPPNPAPAPAANLIPQGSAAFIQLAPSTLLWIADWTAARVNDIPNVPDKVTNDPNWVLLDDWYEPAQVVISNDGVTPLYRISGTYIYGHRNPDPNTLKHVAFGVSPWIKVEDAMRRVPDDHVTRDLLEPNDIALRRVVVPG